MSAAIAGAYGEPFELQVELGKVREFAAATKAVDAAWTHDAEPFTPPTFLTADRFWAGPDAAPPGAKPRDWGRILHGEQEYVFHGPPPRSGATLTAQRRIEDRYEKLGRRGGAMTFTVVLTEYRDESGTLVAEARSTSIETSQAATP